MSQKISLILIAFVVAVVTAAVTTHLIARNQEATLKTAIATYIEENPAFILKVLSRHANTAAETNRNAALSLATETHDKTIIGNHAGDVTIYEFSDYNCGYCKRVFADLLEVIEEDGNIRLVIKEFPILAESSLVAARYGLAIAEIGGAEKFEAFHTAMMVRPGRFNEDTLKGIAGDVGIDAKTLADTLKNPAIDTAIHRNRQAAEALDLSGTPAFIIGNRIVPGAIGKKEFLALIAEARKP